MAKYESDFGIGIFTGLDEVVNQNKTSSLLTYGAVSQLIVPVQVVEGKLAPTDNAAAGSILSGIMVYEGFDRGAAMIPAGAVIKDCYLVVRGATTDSSTTIDVGTYEKDGTVIDADGLLDGAATDATGLVNTVAGALKGTKVTKDSYIKVTSTDAASKFEGVDIDIIVEFI